MDAFSQIIGPVIDVYFDTKGLDPEKVLPKINEALTVNVLTVV
jgi:F-type H+-transporting ATPase subunit beta